MYLHSRAIKSSSRSFISDGNKQWDEAQKHKQNIIYRVWWYSSFNVLIKYSLVYILDIATPLERLSMKMKIKVQFHIKMFLFCMSLQTRLMLGARIWYLLHKDQNRSHAVSGKAIFNYAKYWYFQLFNQCHHVEWAHLNLKSPVQCHSDVPME